MQADTLRLILLVLGGVLILGIYLWERRRSRKLAGQSRQQPKDAPQAPAPRGPHAGGEIRSREELSAEEEFADLPPLHVEHPHLNPSEKKGKPRKGPFGWGKRTEDPTGARSASDTAQSTEEPYHSSESGVPHLILMINIAAKQDRFAGEDIARIASALGLEPGAMSIYHRYEQPGAPNRVLFSMASMFEPGTFPFEAMAGFSTAGLSLFAQLPGPRDGQVIYETMLNAARQLAEKLGGELQDETHSVLSRQTIEHVRSQIAEHRRQVTLATKHP